MSYEGAARFYDVIHDARGRDAVGEANLVMGEARRLAPTSATLLDVGCGTGPHLARFAEEFDIVGVDLSAHMLSIAAERAPGVVLVEGDFRTFELDGLFDVAVSLFSGIGYLTELEDLRSAIVNMAAHLTPGGVLLIEGWVEPDYWSGDTVHSEPDYWSGDTVHSESGHADGLAVARAARSSRTGMHCEIEMRYSAATSDAITTVNEYHAMRLSDPDEFADAYSAAGVSFARLPHMLHPGRSVYAGVKQ